MQFSTNVFNVYLCIACHRPSAYSKYPILTLRSSLPMTYSQYYKVERRRWWESVPCRCEPRKSPRPSSSYPTNTPRPHPPLRPHHPCLSSLDALILGRSGLLGILSNSPAPRPPGWGKAECECRAPPGTCWHGPVTENRGILRYNFT